MERVRMFANLKISTKVIAGFGIMLVILSGLGIVGYSMFGRVQWNIATLEDHSLSAVRQSTGVEREAFEAIVAEKNYVLYKKDESTEKVKQKLAEVAGSLDSIDKIAANFNDTDLTNKSKEVRGLAIQFGRLYDDCVAAMKSNKEVETTLDAKGALMDDEATAYVTAKKPEYVEARTALQVANLINAEVPKMRLHARMFMLSKEKKHIGEGEKHLGQLLKHFDSLEKMHPNTVEQGQISAAREGNNTYWKAFQQWVTETSHDSRSGKLVGFVDTMNESGAQAITNAEDYLAARDATVNRAADAIFLAAEVARLASTARRAARLYMQSKDPAHWTKLTDQIALLNKCLTDLRKVSVTAEDAQRIDRAEKVTQEYVAAVAAWKENDAKLTTLILPELK
jgi:CHASE3 domain sensor protein